MRLVIVGIGASTAPRAALRATAVGTSRGGNRSYSLSTSGATWINATAAMRWSPYHRRDDGGSALGYRTVCFQLSDRRSRGGALPLGFHALRAGRILPTPRTIHTKRMIHAKAGVIVSERRCGWTNLGLPSLLLNRGCPVLAQDSDTVAALVVWFLERPAVCGNGSTIPSHFRRIAAAVVRLPFSVL